MLSRLINMLKKLLKYILLLCSCNNILNIPNEQLMFIHVINLLTFQKKTRDFVTHKQLEPDYL